MFSCVYDLLTGEFVSCGPCELTWNSAVQGMVKLPRNPDARLERFDAQNGVRLAMVQEIAAYDAARKADNEQQQFDGQKMLKAVALYFAQQLGIQPSVAKAAILTIYRGL